MVNNCAERLASNFYFDQHFNVEAAKILPGKYYATGRDMMLVTVLGSCVAACIRDRKSGIGGMNHFMLPNDPADSNRLISASARYGTYAMEILINKLLQLGARRDNLEAKVFGGGEVLKDMSTTNVGQLNAEFVRKYLVREKIKVVAEDLADSCPRKVHYFPNSGRVMVKKLHNFRSNIVFLREKDYGSHL